MHFAVLSAITVFAAMVQAIRINEPSNTTVWAPAGPGSITWDSVSTDQQTIILKVQTPSNPVEGDLIADSVSTSSGSYTWTPAQPLAAGQYRINAVSADPQNPGILAQSEYFTVGDATSSNAASDDGDTSTEVPSASSSGSASASDATSTEASSTDSTSSSLTVHSPKPAKSTPSATDITTDQNPSSPPNAGTGGASTSSAATPPASTTSLGTTPSPDASSANAQSTPAVSSGAGKLLVVPSGLFAAAFAAFSLLA